MLTGLSLEYEIELVLRAADVRPLTLREGSKRGRLGWDTYLVAETRQRDRNDVHYDARMDQERLTKPP